MTETTDGLKAEAIEVARWASAIMRPGSKGGRAFSDVIERLKAAGSTFGPGEPAPGKVTYDEVAGLLDRDWPEGSDLAKAIAGLVERIREPAAFPSP